MMRAIKFGKKQIRLGISLLESEKGGEGDENFITVVPGYTALDVSFPDADDIGGPLYIGARKYWYGR